VRARKLVPAAAALVALALASPCAAANPQQRLADRYAPIAALADQEKPCTGEAWRPTTVDIVLDNPKVTLHGPGKGNPVVAHAPAAADLFGKGKGYYLDFPGNPLRPRCTYDRDGKRFALGKPSIAYAHIVTGHGATDKPAAPQRLALQYWFFYYFNNFNDKHEADWEGIQLVFNVGSASQALLTEPVEVGYAQHVGGEQADWDSDEVDKVGNHPIVYSAAGSHASYYSTGLWLGTSASEGVGCDDTRGPSTQRPLRAVLLPSRVDSRSSPYAWLAFEGRWGQKAPGADNGPLGPNTKSRWTHPFDWQNDLRRTSIEVPAGGSLGQSVTGAFCSTVAFLSSILTYFYYASPPLTITALVSILIVVLALFVWLVRRTTWSPTATEPIRARRDAGQILRVSRRIYWRRKRLFLGLGVFAFLVAAIVEGIKALLQSFVSLFGEFTLQLSTTAFAVLAVNAAAAFALTRLDSGLTVEVFRTWWFVSRRSLILVGAIALELLVVVALFVLVVAVPFVIAELSGSATTAVVIAAVLLVAGSLWLIRNVVGWAFTAQEICADRYSARAAVRQGPRLVQHNWWRSTLLLVLIYTAGLLSGPIVGFVFLLLTSVDPKTLNLIGSLVYVIVLPYLAIATTLLYFDLKERRETVASPASGAAVPSPI
jgi:Vacuolar protein sorting-associated protein 62